MDAAALLAAIEPLEHAERCRRLADLRRTARPGEVAALLAELDGRGHYERDLALFVAGAVRDAPSLAHIVRTAAAPESDLAAAAIGLAVRHGADAGALGGLVDDAPAASRALLYRAVRRYGRRDLAEALIDRVAARWGGGEAAALLPACGEDAVRARLPHLGRLSPNTATLGRAHPGPLLDHVEREFAGLPAHLTGHWWWAYGPGIAAAAPHAPDRVLGLLERHWHRGPFPAALRKRLGLLLDAAPGRVVALLTAPDRRHELARLLWQRSFRDRLPRLADGDVAALARAVRSLPGAHPQFVGAFPPARRAEVFALVAEGRDPETAIVDEALLDVLPAAARAREARRMLGLRGVAERPDAARRTAAHLPYDEAGPVLVPLTRSPDADERATGYRLLVACAGRARDPRVLTRLLEALGRLRNDQEPVRAAALNALARIPFHAVRAEHGAALIALTDDALRARDVSGESTGALARIAVGLCRQSALRNDAEILATGAGIFGRLVAGLGRMQLLGLPGALRRGHERAFTERLAPGLDEAARRGDHAPALALATALGRRGHDLPAVRAGLAAALDARVGGTVRQAVQLWLEPPGPRRERVAALLARDPSMILLPAVFERVAAQRTDLLGAALAGTPPAGMFAVPGPLYVPSAGPQWTRRWTAAQRGRYLRLLHRRAGDTGETAARRQEAVRLIAHLPGAEVADLRRHLRYEATRRAALTGAPWTARPQDALPLLLSHAGSDDAHVAVYAAARAARSVRPSALPALLGPVLAGGKITARKEAVRILLDNRAPGALDALAAAFADPGQHRDVRGAIVAAARRRFPDPAAERILAEAVTGPRDLARAALGARPPDLPEDARARYAALVLQVAASPDPETRREALPAVPAWAPWAPDAPALLAAQVADLDATATWRASAAALVACAAAGHGAAGLAAAADRLAAAPAGPDAEGERDRPAAQRLAALVDEVEGLVPDDRDGAERAAAALDGRLPEPAGAALAAATLRWDGPGTAAALDALADRPAGGVLAVRDVADRLADAPDPGAVLPHAARLAARGDLAGGLFAAALVTDHGEEAGWPGPWRALLRGLRAHPEPEVRYLAETARTAAE
ncbi:hypothetical protein [Actinomadura parmotrematis]|uniref:HEAT repeat domain-containing protein n=1 Tax=Actinomadura parmotrematis TaxID=2864039 RepID=A0ABS7FQ61_9ACTN|nr:hypothetical protein [Actinomadura parmotrematis]MBW8482540.1 hypothetical protein [Actinomadura parmotrematis]